MRGFRGLRVKRARASLEEASAAGGRFLAAVALGEADASASPVKAAAANLEKAEADYALKKDDRGA